MRAISGYLETLESRWLLASVSVNAGQVIRAVNDDVLGVNVAWWDSSLNTAQTKTMVQAAGLNAFRFPGGSAADDFHFTDPPSYNGKGTAATFATFIESVGGGGMVTLDYGSGSPQEAAAFLAYLNASSGNPTAIGSGLTWVNNAWTSKDWKTAGYWAGIRAATPLAQDDGLNFLRIGHAAPFGFHFYEIGNEEYGSWETDNHAIGHDPATYVAFAKQFAGYAQTIDPAIAIGLSAVIPDAWYNDWTANVLQQCAAQAFTPGFLIDHNYMQEPGTEDDQTLLLHTASDPASDKGWANRASVYRSLLQQTLGPAAAGSVRLLATEFNSVSYNPGKQTTSLVNGLFTADALGSLLQTEYDGAWIWDLRNGFDTSYNNSPSLYGWRGGGDYGIIGSPGTSPETDTYVPYPTYFAEQLAAKLAASGGSVVSAASNDPYLTAYAVRQASGHLSLLVINKDAAATRDGTFQLAGFTPSSQAQLWQYGKTEDTAQSQTADGHASLTSFSQALSLNGSSFSYSFPSYSMTVIDLAPAAPAPQMLAATYPYDVRPNSVQFTFDSDVSASLSPGDLVLTKLSGGGSAPPVQSVQWNSGTKTATFFFPPGLPANGDYRATLPANSVSNAAGVPMSGDATLDFFVLAGDANRDRKVDVIDLGILASNWQSGGSTFSHGDFNYDGNVDVIDLGILATNWQNTVPAAAAAASSSSQSLPLGPSDSLRHRHHRR